jgi:hypothetical protein
MCGRYTQTAAFDELAQGFGTILENAGPEDLTARSNQFLSQNVPIIVVSKGVQQLVLVIILCTGISLGACAQRSCRLERGPGPVRREGWPEGCDGDGLQGRAEGQRGM